MTDIKTRLQRLEAILTSRDSLREQYSASGEQLTAKLIDLAQRIDQNDAIDLDSPASWVAYVVFSAQPREAIAARFSQAVAAGQRGAVYAFEVLSAGYENMEGNRT